MAENKIAKVPVASHGLHKHDYNYPWLSSINFGDVMPCYYNTVRRGERDIPKAGLYSQLMPIAHNAFATGRYNFKGVFVPYKLVWRPWYAFDQQTAYYSNGVKTIPGRYPYITMGRLSDAFVKVFAMPVPTPDPANPVTPPSVDSYDICYIEDPVGHTYPDDYEFRFISNAGRRVLRILGALGCTPNFIMNDNKPVNILALMCYIKAFSDYYFPNNYVGGTYYNTLAKFFDTDTIDFNSVAEDLMHCLDYCSLNFYENSVFDLAWDNPVAPNVNAVDPVVFIPDATNLSSDLDYVCNDELSHGTPLIQQSGHFTQYVLNALKSLTLWTKRRQLAGARLLEKFLVSRGISLPNDSARISYLLGERNVEIQVSGVENTTDTNLGELAGRGVASSGNEPLSFECRADDDGIFFVIVSAIPDANFPVYLDGFANREDFLDNYTAEYDKLGSAAVPCRLFTHTCNAEKNFRVDPEGDGVFGFLNQYWDEVQERPRLLGDFMLQSRGAQELQAYHTFRMFDPNGDHEEQISHGFGFIRMADSWQYQRLFYSSAQENLMLFLRWYGSQYKEKLPLGDSYEWDDDELNRKVSVVVGGSQK